MKHLFYAPSFWLLLYLVSEFSVRSTIQIRLRSSSGSSWSSGSYENGVSGDEDLIDSPSAIKNEKCIQTKLSYSVVSFYYTWKVENLREYMIYCRKFNKEFLLNSPDLVLDTVTLLGNWQFSLLYDSSNRLRFQATFSSIREKRTPEFELKCKIVTEANEISLPDLYSRDRSLEWRDITHTISQFAKNDTIGFQLTVNYYSSPEIENNANENHYSCENERSVVSKGPSAKLTYSPPFTDDLSNLMQDDKYIDVIIKAKNDTDGIQAHRIILANSSPILAFLVYNSTYDKNESIIDMEDIDHDVVKKLVTYLYTGKIDDIEQVVDRLILVAYRFELNNLKAICESFLIKNVKLDNALKLYSLGMNTFSADLSKKAFAVMRENKTKLATRSEEFRTLSVQYPNLMFELFVS